MTSIFCKWGYLPDGWRPNVRITVSGGRISQIQSEAEPVTGDMIATDGLLVPAPGNLHSHAFQRAMAGHGERRSAGEDSFWTWREAMYAFLEHLNPDDVGAIAAFAYMEMLEAGYAAVGEFHYLHHGPGGAPYDDPAAMSHAIAAAAGETGIGLTHLPVLYSRGGVADEPLNDRQERFGNDLADFSRLHDAIRLQSSDSILGVAAHSIRAVTRNDIQSIPGTFGNGPIHIHIAEQTAEVTAVEDAYGARPVEWLLDNAGVDERWCLVHATHMTEAETIALARTGAIAGLCPITEGNLGDGIFNGPTFIANGGRYGIGSDSHVLIGLTEELRLLEYSQRFRDRRRTVLRDGPGSVGQAMFDAVLIGGAQALGRDAGRIETGCWADFVMLDGNRITPFVPDRDQWLDHWIFVAGDRAVTDVWWAGRHVVTKGRHVRRDAIERDFRNCLARLFEKMTS
ncbi:MAG: formimidoylglutamate deiminase [Alphaproteobacteria bacterium]